MLEEAITFCQTKPSSILKDIRFVVFQRDQALISAFAQEMATLQSKHKAPMPQEFQRKQQRQPVYSNESHVITAIHKQGVAVLRSSIQRSLSIQVVYGDLTKEKTDAIINIITRDMNMSIAGELSKAILKAGGPQIQQECSQHGKQTPGTAVMTSGGNLAVRHVIHIIPGLLNVL